MLRTSVCPWCSANLHSQPLVSERHSVKWRGIPLYPVSTHFCSYCGGQLQWRFPGAMVAVVMLCAYVGLIWWLLGFGFYAKLAAISGIAALLLYLRAVSFADRGNRPPTRTINHPEPHTTEHSATGL